MNNLTISVSPPPILYSPATLILPKIPSASTAATSSSPKSIRTPTTLSPGTPKPNRSSTLSPPPLKLPPMHHSIETPKALSVVERIRKGASKYNFQLSDEQSKHILKVLKANQRQKTSFFHNFKRKETPEIPAKAHLFRAKTTTSIYMTPKDLPHACGGTKIFRKCLCVTLDNADQISVKWKGRLTLKLKAADDPVEFEKRLKSMQGEATFIKEKCKQFPIICPITLAIKYEGKGPKYVIYTKLFDLEWNNVPKSDLLAIFKRYLHDIHELQEAGIFHSDLKKDNMVIRKTSDGGYELALIDWGSVGKRVAQTHAFKPPEQLAGGFDNPSKGEVWSLGCAFYQIHYGHMPRWSHYQEIYMQLKNLHKLAVAQAETTHPTPATSPSTVPENTSTTSVISQTEKIGIMGNIVNDLCNIRSDFIGSFGGHDSDKKFTDLTKEAHFWINQIWEDPASLAKFAAEIEALHQKIFSYLGTIWSLLSTTKTEVLKNSHDTSPRLESLLRHMLRPDIATRITMHEAAIFLDKTNISTTPTITY